MTIRRILVQTSGPKLGDFLMMTPALTGLRQAHPNAQITLLRWSSLPNPWLEPFHPLFDEVIGGEGSELFSSSADAWRLLKEVRSRRFDAAVSLNARSRFAWLFRLAGIPVRIGNATRYYRHLFTCNLIQGRGRPQKHEVEYNYDMMRPLDASGSPGPMIYPVTEAAAIEAERLLEGCGWDRITPLVIINPTYGGSSRKWPEDCFITVGKALRTARRVQIALIGMRSDGESNAQIARSIGRDVLDLTGKTDVGVLAAILQRSALHLSIDTGTSHLAAAMGLPCVTVFPSHEHWDQSVRWRPWMTQLRLHGPAFRCQGCQPYRCSRTRTDCIESISCSDVVQSMLELLGNA